MGRPSLQDGQTGRGPIRIEPSTRNWMHPGWLAGCLLFALAAEAQQGGLGPPFQISASAPGVFDGVSDVATGPNGEFTVVWESTGSAGTDSDQQSIQARRYTSAGQPSASQFQVNSVTTGRQRAPSIAIRDSGEAIVVWRNQDDIAGRRLDASGSPIGSEFAVAATADTESAPDVATTPDRRLRSDVARGRPSPDDSDSGA